MLHLGKQILDLTVNLGYLTEPETTPPGAPTQSRREGPLSFLGQGRFVLTLFHCYAFT